MSENFRTHFIPLLIYIKEGSAARPLATGPPCARACVGVVVVVGDGRRLVVVGRRSLDGAACGGPTPLLMLLCPLNLLVQGVEAPGRGGAVEGAATDRGAIICWPVGRGCSDAVPSRRAAESGVGWGELRRAGEVSSERRQPPTAGHPG